MTRGRQKDQGVILPASDSPLNRCTTQTPATAISQSFVVTMSTSALRLVLLAFVCAVIRSSAQTVRESLPLLRLPTTCWKRGLPLSIDYTGCCFLNAC